MIHFISIFIIAASSIAHAQVRGAGRAKTTTSSSVSDRQFFGVGIGYSNPFEIKFGNARLSGIAGEPTVRSEFEGAPILELDIRIMPKNSVYGLQLGIIADLEHKNKSTTISGVNNSTSVFEKSKLAITTVEISLAGRFERLFVTVGSNYSIPSFTASPDFIGSVSMRGGSNTHLGFGYFISDHYSIEIMLWRRKGFRFDTTSSSGAVDSYETGEAVTSTLALKYFPKLLN